MRSSMVSTSSRSTVAPTKPAPAGQARLANLACAAPSASSAAAAGDAELRPLHSAAAGGLTKAADHADEGERWEMVGDTAPSVVVGEPRSSEKQTLRMERGATAGSGSESWAVSRLPTATEVRAAVTTARDAQSDFVQALVEEINLLRADPKGYAVMFEREATLGYPFVCGEDEYFDSDAAADVVHSYQPAVLEAVSPKHVSTSSTPNVHASAGVAGAIGSPVSRRPISADRESTSSGQTHGEDPHPHQPHQQGVESRRRSRSRSLGTANGSTNKNMKGGHAGAARKQVGAGSRTGSEPSRDGDGSVDWRNSSPPPPKDPALCFRTTLKSYGMPALNLAQLRTHFRRHQRHRAALEAALKEAVHHWQQAQQAQREAWALEDERVTKKAKRGNNAGGSGGNGGGGGAGGTGAGSRKRSTPANAACAEEVLAARQSMMTLLNSAFAEQLRAVYSELQREREVCRRVMEGANVILDCLRALKEAQPAPPLRFSNGLTLAAREASSAFHASEARAAAVMERQRIADACGAWWRQPRLAESDGPQPPGEFSLLLQEAEASATPRTAATGGTSPYERESTGQENETAKASALLDVMLRPTKPASRLHSGAEGSSQAKSTDSSVDDTAAHVLAALGMSARDVLTEVEELNDITRACCGTYGYISGEVRGLQLYGAGSARALVMRALLGVAGPIFSFTERARSGAELDASVDPSRGSDRNNVNSSSSSTENRSSETALVQRGATAGEVVVDVSGGDTASALAVSSPGALLAEKSIFNPVNGQLAGSADGEDGSPTSRFEDEGRTAAAAMVLCGALHPTTRGAATHFTAEEVAQTTTAGRRAAQAALRLGPFLWGAAHLVGCAWQQIEPLRAIPTFDEAVAQQQLPEEAASGIVGTTIVVASGFEELDVVRRHGGNFGLAEIRRVVHEKLGGSGSGDDSAGASPVTAMELALSARRPFGPAYFHSNSISISSKQTSVFSGAKSRGHLPAVVDLHSALGVELLAPLTHPLHLPDPSVGDASREAAAVVVIAAKAAAQHVQLQACVTSAMGTAIPRAPRIDPEVVLVQRSPENTDVTLILVDVAAVAAKLSQSLPAKSARLEALVHIYELRKAASDELGETGFASRRTSSPAAMPFSASCSSLMPPPNMLANTADGRCTAMLSCEDSARDDGGADDVSGYAHIGFIRLVIGSGAVASGEHSVGGSSAKTITWGSVTHAATGHAVRVIPHLRSSTPTPMSSTSTTPTLDAGAEAFTSSLSLSSRSATTRVRAPPARMASGAAPRMMGWPVVSQDFADRCASILSPLTAYLSACEEDGGDGVMHVAVHMPPKPASCYRQRHLAALKAQLAALQAVQQAEDEGGEEEEEGAGEEVLVEQAIESAPDTTDAPDMHAFPALSQPGTDEVAPSPPPTVTPKPPTRNSVAEKQVPGQKAAATSVLREQAARQPSQRGGSRNRASSSAGSAAAAWGGKGSEESLRSGEEGTAGLSPELQLMLLTPIAELRRRRFFDAAYLAAVRMQTLEEAVEALTRAAHESQDRLQRAKAVLDGELERLRADGEKRKGRELLRLKQEESDMERQLHGAQAAVAELVDGAAAARDVLLRRTRDRALRLARIGKLTAELARLMDGQTSPPRDGASEGEDSVDQRVLLWLCAPPSSSLSTSREGKRVPASSLSATPPPPARADHKHPSSFGAVAKRMAHSCAAGRGHCIELVRAAGKGEGCAGGARDAFTYEASFRIPQEFKGGRAVLFVDDMENVAWHIA